MFLFLLLLGLFGQSLCFLDDPNQAADLLNRLTVLENRTQFLANDIKSKNDLTQFLQSNVLNLNGSLIAEQTKSANLETKVADLERRLQNQISSSGELAGDVKAASNLAKSLRTQLDSAKQTIQTQDLLIQRLNTSLLQSMSQANIDLAMVYGNLTALQQTLATSTNSQTVYFTYRNSDQQIPNNTSQTLKFHGRITNQGNAFNESTGEFVAPVPGVYWFSLTLGVAATDFLNCYIVKDNQFFLVEVFSSAYSAYTSASSSVNVFLNKGDKVSVGGCKGTGTISPYKSSFAGMLVHED